MEHPINHIKSKQRVADHGKVFTLSSTFSRQGPLFANLGMHEIFRPAATCPPQTVAELATLNEGNPE